MDIWTKIVAVNIGAGERWGRGVLGLGLIVLALALPTAWGWLGFYPLLTAVLGTSPLYKLFGINTGPKPKVVLKTPPPVGA
jgi:hypothetical protein